jgi:hypothetical protein
MYDAVTSMGTPRHPTASLLPSGHNLDLFVTLTDYHGYQQLVQIHDPPLIHELEHHHVLQFTYRRRPNGEVESDFDLDNAPALAFAARATAYFPGAFPPARIVEMDELVASKQGAWPRRDEFIGRAFRHHARPASTRPWPRSSTARCSTTGRFRRRSRRSRPARLSPGRSPAGLYRAASGAAGAGGTPQDAGFFATCAARSRIFRAPSR